MEPLIAAAQARDYPGAASILGQGHWFAGLLTVAAVLLVLASFVRLPMVLKALVWLGFLIADVLILLLAFGAPAEATDYDYAAVTRTPPASLEQTTTHRTSSEVCVAMSEQAYADARRILEQQCSPRPDRTALDTTTYKDGRACYSVEIYPLPGEECSASFHLEQGHRQRRDGLLQTVHRWFGIDPDVPGSRTSFFSR